MGYWSNTMENIPGADLLKKSIAHVEPATLAELEAADDLGAFVCVKADECMKSIRTTQLHGKETTVRVWSIHRLSYAE